MIRLNKSKVKKICSGALLLFSLAVIATLLFVFLTPAPYNDPPPTPDPTPPTTQNETAEPLPTPPEAGPAPMPPLHTAEAAPDAMNLPMYIAERVLFDINGIRLTVTGLQPDTFSGMRLNVYIENNSDYAIRIGTQYESINGLMFPYAVLSETVTPGNRSNTRVSLPQHRLDQLGVETIGVIELAFFVVNTDDWNDQFVTDIFTITTSAYGYFTQPLPETAQTVFARDGIYIDYIGKNETLLSVDFLFLIKNTTPYTMFVRTTNEAVNGLMVSGVMSSDIKPGKFAITPLTFSRWRLEDNYIEYIEAIEFNFYVQERGNWDSLVESELITITPF